VQHFQVQCLHRWQKVLDPNIVKGPWTVAEDDRLRALVTDLGAKRCESMRVHASIAWSISFIIPIVGVFTYLRYPGITLQMFLLPFFASPEIFLLCSNMHCDGLRTSSNAYVPMLSTQVGRDRATVAWPHRETVPRAVAQPFEPRNLQRPFLGGGRQIHLGSAGVARVTVGGNCEAAAGALGQRHQKPLELVDEAQN
jgi:hypothetical protein